MWASIYAMSADDAAALTVSVYQISQKPSLDSSIVKSFGSRSVGSKTFIDLGRFILQAGAGGLTVVGSSRVVIIDRFSSWECVASTIGPGFVL